MGGGRSGREGVEKSKIRRESTKKGMRVRG
jgi:hypothetical protein